MNIHWIGGKMNAFNDSNRCFSAWYCAFFNRSFYTMENFKIFRSYRYHSRCLDGFNRVNDRFNLLLAIQKKQFPS